MNDQTLILNNNTELTIIQKYTSIGIIFGLIFPLLSILIDSYFQGYALNLQGIGLIHHNNPIHYIVDTAPLILGIAGFLLGIAHQRKNNINADLMKVNQELDSFTFKITHDLKSPAANIKGLLNLLQSHDNDPNMQKLILEKLGVTMDNWLVTFNDFIELLKHEKQGVKVKSKIDLNEIIEVSLSSLSLEIEASQAEIKYDFDAGHELVASKEELVSIFNNLLSNAIKYSHPDRNPLISINSHISKQYLTINFRDNGIGINLKEYENRLFKKFERTNEKSNVQGSGIGLYLVKEQVEKNGGKIKVLSTPNKGSEFTIELPI